MLGIDVQWVDFCHGVDLKRKGGHENEVGQVRRTDFPLLRRTLIYCL